MKQVALMAACALLMGIAPGVRADEWHDYVRSDQLNPMPEGVASLYRAPWRANVRTVSAHDALQGVGVYYKHMPMWDAERHTAVLKQLYDAGMRRARLAPHFGIYLELGWEAPDDRERDALRYGLQGCHAAGIRPCVVFVHIPPAGEAGTDELNRWWRGDFAGREGGWNKDLPPVGEVGTPAFDAYLDLTYRAVRYIMDEARAAGFTTPGSYDLELGQGLWWGAPMITRPLPAPVEWLLPGGRIYEFERAIKRRARAQGYDEPTLWSGITHHDFDSHVDADVAPEAAGRAISFYDQGTGLRTTEFLERANDTWPPRPPHTYEHGNPPDMVLARPEGWMADRSRRENLIELINRSSKPNAITALGVVPKAIEGLAERSFDGWQIKQRALPRALAFWLNQGAEFILIHSAYEGDRGRWGELEHALIPGNIDPFTFQWSEAPPLVTLRSFCDALAGATVLDEVEPLSFRFAVVPDPIVIPATGDHGPMRASDLVALLPFQISANEFAVAAYVLTPNVVERMQPLRMQLEIDRTIETASFIRPYNGLRVQATDIRRTQDASTLSFFVFDDVLWVRFTVAQP